MNKSWKDDINGTYQFQLCHKLKRLKRDLKAWAKTHFGKEKQNAENARAALLDCQTKIDLHPNDMTYRALENDLLIQFLDAIRIEEEVAKQKAKIHWLEVGDRNTKYFHNAIKGRRNRNNIVKLTKPDGSVTNDITETKAEAIRYFESMLGSNPTNNYPGLNSMANIVNKRVSQDHFEHLASIPNDDEIKRTLFSIHSNKAPGPDGFNAFFFKHCWNTVGPLVLNAIKEFFNTGELLKESNSTIISLIPKIPNPSAMNEFRPISCCNTVYKCISKLISNRLQAILPDLIGESQSAFIKGRKISDNVLLAQDLLRDYHKGSGQPRVAAKVDLMKAYDTVNWEFLFDLLQVLQFPPIMIAWIKACVSSPKFSINFNGESIGYFAGARGLRQGDPLSPYLFVIIMDFLDQLMQRNISINPLFKYHWKCDKLKIAHLCFADDLLILFHGSAESSLTIRHTLDLFYDYTGLRANNSKSCLFICAVNDVLKDQIGQTLQFPFGELPVRYLGVPLISSKLKKDHCKDLLDKITKRITSWNSRFLSFGGRVQLIKSVLFGIQGYWASMFILPKSILKDIEKLFRRFLWTGDIDKSQGAKIAWDTVCKDKKEGGLGFKNVTHLNSILNLKYIWALVQTEPQSLWIKWIHTYMLKFRSFWAVNPPAVCSWYWRKLLKLRPMARNMIKYRIGNGCNTSLWYDHWHPKGPLLEKYGSRVMYDAALPKDAKVDMVIQDEDWSWPITNTLELMEIRRELTQLPKPSRSNDRVIWTPSPNGKFNLTHTWNHCFGVPITVHWYHLVWFAKATPRFAFILWMAIHNRLSTQDRISGFTPGPLACYFCSKALESHDHLFFNCSYTSVIWQGIQRKLNSHINVANWNDLVHAAADLWKARKPAQLISRICFAATVYYVWQERNNRAFNGAFKPSDVLLSTLTSNICNLIRVAWREDVNMPLYIAQWQNT